MATRYQWLLAPNLMVKFAIYHLSTFSHLIPSFSPPSTSRHSFSPQSAWPTAQAGLILVLRREVQKLCSSLDLRTPHLYNVPKCSSPVVEYKVQNDAVYLDNNYHAYKFWVKTQGIMGVDPTPSLNVTNDKNSHSIPIVTNNTHIAHHRISLNRKPRGVVSTTWLCGSSECGENHWVHSPPSTASQWQESCDFCEMWTGCDP